MNNHYTNINTQKWQSCIKTVYSMQFFQTVRLLGGYPIIKFPTAIFPLLYRWFSTGHCNSRAPLYSCPQLCQMLNDYQKLITRLSKSVIIISLPKIPPHLGSFELSGNFITNSGQWVFFVKIHHSLTLKTSVEMLVPFTKVVTKR